MLVQLLSGELEHLVSNGVIQREKNRCHCLAFEMSDWKNLLF